MSFRTLNISFKCGRWKYVRCAKLLAGVAEYRGLKERNIGSLITVWCNACQFQRGVETPFGASMLSAPGRPLVSEADAMAGRPILINGSWSVSNMAVTCAQWERELLYYVWWKRQVESFFDKTTILISISNLSFAISINQFQYILVKMSKFLWRFQDEWHVLILLFITNIHVSIIKMQIIVYSL